MPIREVTALNTEMIIYLVAGLVVGGVLGAVLRSKSSGSKLANAEREAAQIVESSKKEAETIRKEAEIQSKDVVFKAKAAWEDEVRESRKELQSQEKRLVQKEENLDRKVSQVETRDQDLTRREQSLLDRDRNLQQRTDEVEALIAEQRVKLEKVSGLSSEEAKQQLIIAMESEARHDAAKLIRQIEDEAKENADKKAKKILSLTIQRYAGDYVAEKTINSVALPSDEMKGRIIGREGRNIRAIEAATGIDLIIDDTPEAVIISGFNPVRREVARLSLERLIHALKRWSRRPSRKLKARSARRGSRPPLMSVCMASTQRLLSWSVGYAIGPLTGRMSCSTPWKFRSSAASWPLNLASISSRPSELDCYMISVRLSTMKLKVHMPLSVGTWPASMVSPQRSSTP
jgi:hypothetical protein